MKVRFGIGTAGHVEDPAEFEWICTSLLTHGFDSIWVSEVLTQPGLDPLVSLAWLAGRLETLKIGTTFLVPGRNVIRMARQLATLDYLSNGRLLVTAVPGLVRGDEANAVGVAPSERSSTMDETLPVLRSLLAGVPTDVVTRAGTACGVTLDPLPKQQPLEIWLGGTAPKSLDRCGRFADGWLPTMLSADDAVKGRRRIEEAASQAGRVIDPEHYGVSIGYAAEPLPPSALDAIRRRAKREDVDEILPQNLSDLRRLIEGYLEVGFSKFVLRPLSTPANWDSELKAVSGVLGDLQT